MIGSATAWRRALKIWLPGLVLLIINLGVLSTYRLVLAGQAQLRSSRVERLTAELADLRDYRSALDDVLARAEDNRLRIEEFYGRWLSSEADRLTQVITAVKGYALGLGVEWVPLVLPDGIQLLLWPIVDFCRDQRVGLAVLAACRAA